MADEDDDKSWDEVREEITAAVAIAVRAAEGSMMTRFLLVVETMNDDGQRLVSVWPSSDMRQWDALGFLHYGVATAEAWVHRTQNDA